MTIRDLPDDVHDVLTRRAARSGHSLEDYLRAELIRIANWPDPEEWVAQVRRRKLDTGVTLSRDEILEYRRPESEPLD